MANAIATSADWNQNAIRMMSRILMFTDSTRARDDVELVGAAHRQRAVSGQYVADPSGAVADHVADRLAPVRAEPVEEAAHAAVVRGLARPDQSAGVVIRNDQHTVNQRSSMLRLVMSMMGSPVGPTPET
jgi:hypothetical protein